MVGQLLHLAQFFDTPLPDPEQVIEVPKIFPDDVRDANGCSRDPQLAELLVEVPTIVSYSWLQLRLEQNVDIPVPGRGGWSSGLHGFFPDRVPPFRFLPQNAFLSGLWSRPLRSPLLVEILKAFV